jgi:hypothetical protein
MIFSRRAIQHRLNELRSQIGDTAVDSLVDRLNRPGRDRLAAVWEVAVIHGLAKQGGVAYEQALQSGRQPDLRFMGSVPFTVDVTTVSDEGLDRDNPYEELSTELERLKKKLRLPIGGTDLQVGSKREQVRGGQKTTLLLPSRSKIRQFLREQVEPLLREQIARGEEVLTLHIADGECDLKISIDPRKSPYNSGGFASYDTPTIRDRNPLYGALKAKAQQLRAATGLKGIIVGDAGSRSLVDRAPSWNALGVREIVTEFLRQHSSIQFVLVITVAEESPSWMRRRPPRQLSGSYFASRQSAGPPEIETIMRSMMGELPQPTNNGDNAARRAKEPGYWWGHHGGHEMSDRRIKIGSREVLEVLAGRRSVQEMNEAHGWHDPQKPTDRSRMPNPFELMLQRGRLPKSVTIETDENESDDWLEIEFGDVDPAISPFR